MSEWLKSKLSDGEECDVVAAAECISKCQTDTVKQTVCVAVYWCLVKKKEEKTK